MSPDPSIRPIPAQASPDGSRAIATRSLDAALPATVLPRRHIKRAFDVIAAAALLLVTSPVLLAIAVAIKFDSPGPILYRVRRVGRDGAPLMMLKFRKMTDDAVGAPLTAANDARLTRVGAVLTRTRLDELPQLWDVLRGRMSIVGPRPEDPQFVALHHAEYAHILRVAPGITGLSQIAYKEESRIVDADSPVADYVDRIMPQKLTMDALYADTPSLRLDASILFWTFITVALRRPVSVNRLNGSMRIRHRRPAPPPLRLADPPAGMLAAPDAEPAAAEPERARRQRSRVA